MLTNQVDLVKEFMSYVSRDIRPDGCWIWIGHIGSSGYPTFRGKKAYVRSVEIFYGVPDAIKTEYSVEPPHIDHVCHTIALKKGLCHGGKDCLHRRCVNPIHLEPVSRQENAYRRRKPLKPKRVTIIEGWIKPTDLAEYFTSHTNLTGITSKYVLYLIKNPRYKFKIRRINIRGQLIIPIEDSIEKLNTLFNTDIRYEATFITFFEI
jgi:hypothetical protein